MMNNNIKNYEVYEKTFEPNYINLNCLDSSFSLKIQKVSAFHFGWKKAVYWRLATLWKTRVYCVYDGDKLIHYSFVVRGKEKFTFLKKADIEIGPCWTDPDYRGKGIYPYVLGVIVKDELRENAKAYMIILDANLSSKYGVMKAGFLKTKYYAVKNFAKRYKLV